MSKNVNSSSESTQHLFFRNLAIGSFSGICAVGLIQPMIYLKNSVQSKSAPPSSNLRIWYRGVGGFAASFAPTIAIQTAANGIFLQYLNPFLSASLAGGASALCPANCNAFCTRKTK